MRAARRRRQGHVAPPRPLKRGEESIPPPLCEYPGSLISTGSKSHPPAAKGTTRKARGHSLAGDAIPPARSELRGCRLNGPPSNACAGRPVRGSEERAERARWRPLAQVPTSPLGLRSSEAPALRAGRGHYPAPARPLPGRRRMVAVVAAASARSPQGRGSAGPLPREQKVSFGGIWPAADSPSAPD